MSFGEELKRERELRDISLREISESTKISRRYLEALESNEFESLPGGVFNRGFVRAYSKFIGVDPESMVDAYMQEEQKQGIDVGPSSSRVKVNGVVSSKRLWVWIAIGVLVIAAASYAAWHFWPTASVPAATQVEGEVSP